MVGTSRLKRASGLVCESRFGGERGPTGKKQVVSSLAALCDHFYADSTLEGRVGDREAVGDAEGVRLDRNRLPGPVE